MNREVFTVFTTSAGCREMTLEQFDEVRKAIAHLLEVGPRCGRPIPTAQLLRKVRDADDRLELSDAEVFVVNACINATGWTGEGVAERDALQSRIWSAILAGRKFDTEHPAGADVPNYVDQP